MKKKIISILLSSVMIFSMGISTVSAALDSLDAAAVVSFDSDACVVCCAFAFCCASVSG